MNPADRKYTREHEWIKLEASGEATMGITHYAQEQLGDVVYIILPSVGNRVEQGKKLAEVESVKAVSDIYAPASGKVTAVNEELNQKPELLNQEPYGRGWITRLRISEPHEVERLLSVQQYEAFLQQKEPEA